tara:strand:+ start:429 stop:1001 length:573 start_codon:yes stop_codon:yes gene_type:complete
MKKILLLVISILLIFSSCKKEEENPSNTNNTNNNSYITVNPNSIIGLWKHDYILQNTQHGYLNPNTNSEVILFESLNNINVPLFYDPFNDNNLDFYGKLHFWFDGNLHRLTDFNDTVGGGSIQLEDRPYTINGSDINLSQEENEYDVKYSVIKNTNTELDFDFNIELNVSPHPDTIYFIRFFGTVNTFKI